MLVHEQGDVIGMYVAAS